MGASTHTQLTDIPGVGPATAEKISTELGYQSVTDLLIGYLTTDAPQIQDTVRNPNEITQAIPNSDLTNEDLGVDNFDYSAPLVMGFIREHKLTKANTVESVDDKAVMDKRAGQYDRLYGAYLTPQDIKWSHTEFVSGYSVLTLSFGDVPFTQSFVDALENPDNVETDTHTTFTANGCESILSKQYVRSAERLFNINLEENTDLVRVNGEHDERPVIIECPGKDAYLNIAPRYKT